MTTTLQPGDVVVTASGVLYELRNVLPWPAGRTTYVLAPVPPWVKVSPLYAGLGRPATSSRRVATPPRFVSSGWLRTAAHALRVAEVRATSLNPNSPAGPLAGARDYLANAVQDDRDTPDMLARARAELDRLTTLEVAHDG